MQTENLYIFTTIFDAHLSFYYREWVFTIQSNLLRKNFYVNQNLDSP